MKRIAFSPSIPCWLFIVLAASVLPGSLRAQVDSRPLAECPPSNSSRIVVPLSGVVRDRRSDTPLPSASVVLEYRTEGATPTGEVLEARGDELGRYQFCNLTAFTEVNARATYRGVAGRETRVRLDRPQEIDLVVDLGDPAFLVFSVLSAETGEPVRGAYVQLSPIRLGGVTDSLGRVGLPEVPPGLYSLEVRHVAFDTREVEVSVEEGQLAELRVDLVTRVVAVEPLRVTITGRDPVLLGNGFYDRRGTIEDGYFADHEEVQPYVMFQTLFRFKRELVIKYRAGRIYLVNGRPASRLGYDNLSELNEIPFTKVRGVEVFRCTEAPARLWNQIPIDDVPLGDECNIVLIWTR